MKMLGFILRICKDFDNIQTLKHLYYSLVRTKLEYCSLAWFPYYRYQCTSLENIQRKFLKYLYFKELKQWPVRNCAQNFLLDKFAVRSLSCRRINSAIVFLYKLIHGKLDCCELLSKLKFYVPRLNSRHRVTLYCHTPRTNIGRKSPVYIIIHSPAKKSNH